MNLSAAEFLVLSLVYYGALYLLGVALAHWRGHRRPAQSGVVFIMTFVLPFAGLLLPCLEEARARDTTWFIFGASIVWCAVFLPIYLRQDIDR